MKTTSSLRALAMVIAIGASPAWCSAASPSFWLPYVATPVTGTTGGKSGLFLIPSNAVGSTPAPEPSWVTESEPTLVGAAFQGFLGGSTPPTSVTPALMIYAAKGADGNSHLYGLNLANPSNSTTAPKPTQITNLSVPSSKVLCAAGQSEGNLSTPDTLSVVVYVVTPEAGTKPGQVGYCQGAPDGTYYLATYTDSDTTAPTQVDIPGGTATLSAIENDGNFDALNLSSGALGGLVYWDSVTDDENLYSSPTFTSSTRLLTGVHGTPLACVSETAVVNGEKNSLAGNYLATVNTAAGFESYVLGASGEVTEFYDGTATDCLTDEKSLFFIGTRNGSDTSTLYQEELTALTTPKTLLTGLKSSSTGGYSLIGSDGTVVVFQNYSISGATVSTTVQTVPVGATSGSGKKIGGPYAGTLVTSFLAPTSGSDWLFLSTMSESASGVSYSSEVLDPEDGATELKVPADTVWESFGPFSTELGGTVLQISGITDKDGGYGGATLSLVTAGASTSPTEITLTGGGSYQVPAGYVLSLTGFFGTSVGAGGLFSPTGASIGAAVNVSKHVIVPLPIANTNVMPLI